MNKQWQITHITLLQFKKIKCSFYSFNAHFTVNSQFLYIYICILLVCVWLWYSADSDAASLACGDDILYVSNNTPFQKISLTINTFTHLAVCTHWKTNTAALHVSFTPNARRAEEMLCDRCDTLRESAPSEEIRRNMFNSLRRVPAAGCHLSCMIQAGLNKSELYERTEKYTLHKRWLRKPNREIQRECVCRRGA